MGETIKWGHFSDLHFNFGDGFGTKLLRDKLLKKIEEDNIKLDFIIITGDISHQGKFLDATLNFINDILTKTECNRENLFICCGNHDIERNDLRSGVISTCIKSKTQDPNYSVDDAALNLLFKAGHDSFFNIYKKITGKIHGDKAHFVEERDSFNIYTINTCILSGQSEEEGKLLVCDNHLYQLSDKSIDNKSKLNIAIGHHSLDCIQKVEQKQFISFLDDMNIDIYLCGHNHDIGYENWSSSENNISQFMCGGVFKDSYNYPSFILTEYNTQTHSCTSEIYSYSTKNYRWNLMTEAMRPFNNGSYSFTPNRLKAEVVSVDKISPQSYDRVIQIPNMYQSGTLSNIDSENVYQKVLWDQLITTITSKRVNPNNIFQNNTSILSRLVEEVKEKHLILCDRIYNKFNESSRYSSLRNLILCFPTDAMLSINQNNDVCFSAITNWLELVNELTSSSSFHTTEVLNLYSDNYPLAIIMPIIQNYDSLFKISSEFIIGDIIGDENIISSLSITKNTIENENSAFFGFADQLKNLKDIVSRKEAGYFCLAADEGYGKTTLLSKLIDCIIESKTFPNSGKISNLLPWLPNMIVVFGGKQVTTVNDAVKMIIEQANLLLVNPVSYNSNTFTLKESSSILYMTFEALTKELGGIIIIIDAVDEFKASDLAFLPESLPKGITVFITARKFPSGYNNGKKIIHSIKHSGFSSKDEKSIMDFYGLSPELKGVTNFVKAVLKRSNGWPLIVCDIKKQLEAANNDITKVKIETSLNSVFFRKKNMWKENDSTECCLWKLLELFSVFASSSYLSRDNIQSYLMTFPRYSIIHSENIANILDCVSDQLISNDGGLYKLKYASFAEYIVDNKTGFTKIDLRKVIEGVVCWLNKYADDNIELLAPLYLGWCDNFDEKIKNEIEQIIDILIDKNKHDILMFIATVLMSKDEPNNTVERCLKYSLQFDENAQLLYASYLFDTIKTDATKKEAIDFYKELSEKENEQAIITYSDMLFSGSEYVELDVEKALELLTKVESKGTNKVLGRIYNIVSKENSKFYDNDRSISILNKLVDKNDISGMAILGSRLIDGKGVKQNKLEGEKWLRKAAESGDSKFMGALGSRLINGKGIKQNKLEGEKWLRKAVEAKDLEYMGELGLRLIDGDGVKRNKLEGEKWLRKSAESGILQYMGALGCRLIDGKGIKQNKPEGEKWLKKSVELGNSQYMGILGSRLIDGDGLKQNIEEGITLCKAAIDKGYNEAANSLGVYYYENKDLDQSIYYLQLGLKSGSKLSSMNLSYIIRKGKYPNYNGTPTIEELLNDLANNQKHPLALINYALYLISDLCVSVDWVKADNYIALINCNDNNNISDVINWWQKISEEGDLEGDLVLGWLCLKRKIKDPNGMTIKERFTKASGTYILPNWLMKQANAL